MMGAVMAAVILAFTGFFVTVVNVSNGVANFEYSLIMTVSFWVFILVIPFITMRSIAEERHSKTEQLLLSLPISVPRIVLAKYFAIMTLVGIPLLIIAVYPPLLSLLSEVDGAVNMLTAYNGWFGLVLMVAAMAAVGMFASSLVENQIIAAVITVVIFFVMYFMSFIAGVFPSGSFASLIALIICAAALGGIVLGLTKNSTAACVVTGVISVALIAAYILKPELLSDLFPSILSSLAFFDVYMYGGANLGVFDLTEIVYYISFAAVFIFLTVESVERRRYN